MTAFPFTHPHIKFGFARFQLQEEVKAFASGKGRANYTEVNDPVWTITFTSTALDERKLAELTAWFTSLRGGTKSALVTQNVVCRPFAHISDPTPAQDTGVLNSITNGNVLAIGSVSASLVLSIGDMIGLETGAYRGVHRVTAVSGTGTTRTVTVEPPVRSYITTGALVRFIQPELVMRPVPGSWSVPDEGKPRVSFTFVESWK